MNINEDILGPVEDEDSVETTPVEFTISVIQYVDVNGNTYVYMGTADGLVYKALFSENEQLLFAQIADVVKGSITDGVLTVENIIHANDAPQ